MTSKRSRSKNAVEYEGGLCACIGYQRFKKTLNEIDYILCEVIRDEVYKGCPLVEEIDDYLKKYNFKRVETNWAGGIWGDAFYIRNNL
jgi:hypothetical protein